MPERIYQAKQTTTKILRNLEEMLNAVALSTVVAFSAYQAYLHHASNVLWVLLGAAAVWSVYQAFKAWITVLNK